MNVEYKDKIYLCLNILLVILIIISMILGIIVPSEKYMVGIICRMVLGTYAFTNGLWLSLTNNKSYLISHKNKSHRRLCGVLLIIVGIGCLITAAMGYGFNGVNSQ